MDSATQFSMHKANVRGGARLGKAEPPWWRRVTMTRVALLLAASTLAIEALLAFRIWVQLSGMELSATVLPFLYDLSSRLVTPFRGLETIQSPGSDVLELSTMIAVEAYVMLAVALFGFALLARMLVRAVSFEFDREGMTVSRREAARQPA